MDTPSSPQQPQVLESASAGRRAAAIRRALDWAEVAAMLGDFREALSWLNLAESIGANIPADLIAQRQLWLKRA
jgi:hypothetical protein